MINCKINENEGFISSIDFLIRKNHTNIGIKGSQKFNKSLIHLRKHYINKWFQLFSGIHRNIENSFQSTLQLNVTENKAEFYCLLLNLNNTRQFDLKARLERIYDEIIKTSNSDIYSIIHFLLLLEKTKDVKLDVDYHFEKVNLSSSSVRLYEDTRSLNAFSESPDLFNYYPNSLFSKNNFQSEYIDKTNCELNEDSPRFMTELSKLSNIKSSVVQMTSSGYSSEIVDIFTQNPTDNKEYDHCSIVTYPFSEFCGKSQCFSDYWENELLAEWKEFEEGRELPRRFVWEDRGRNVGSEKPRISEWRSKGLVNSFTISKALFMFRYHSEENNDMIKKYLNIHSVPLSSWIKDVISLRLGVSSTTFKYDKTMNSFYLASEVPQYLLEQLQSHIKTGTIFARLSLLFNKNIFPNESLIRDRLINRMKDIIAMHRKVLSETDTDFNSLADFSVRFNKFTDQIEYLGFLFNVDPITFQSWPKDLLPNNPLSKGGITLLKHIYHISCSQLSQPFFTLTFYLFEGCLNVVLEQLCTWLFQGVLWDRFHINQANDFIINSNEKYALNKDNQWWSKGFELCEILLKGQDSWIFDRLSTEILRCGKSLKLLSLIDESNLIINHPDIVKHRPSLKLSYSYRSDISSPISKYVEIVRSIAADNLKSHNEKMEKKRNLKKIKEIEAQVAREKFFLKDQNQRLTEEMNSKKRKKIELDSMKEAAENEIKQKKENIEKEKANDKILMEKFSEENRNLIEEIKLEMTKLYAKKFVDAEAREKASLEKIKIYEQKLLTNMKPSNYLKEQETSMHELIHNTVKECITTVDKEEPLIKDSSVINSEPYHMPLPSLSIPLLSDTQSASLFIEDKNKEIKDHHHIISGENPSKTFFSTINLNKRKESNLIENSEKTDSDNNYRQSTAERSLYPGTHPSITTESHFIENFKKINTHGNASESTAQNSLYPDSNDTKTQESHFIEDFRQINTHGHSSQSTIQNSMYFSLHSDYDRKDESRLHIFKSINTRGHSSESTIQNSMYPDLRQTNNNSTAQKSFPSSIIDITLKTSDNSSVIKEPSNFVNSFYAVDFDSLSLPIDRSFVPFYEEQQCSPTEPIELEEELLETLVDRSLVLPIMSQVKLVDSILINTLKNRYHLRDHLKEIRKYLFLQDGHFSSTLLSELFHLLSQSKWCKLSLDNNLLEDIVKSALNCAHGYKKCYCKNVTLSVMKSSFPDQVIFNNKLDDFSLSYSLKWPLNIIINAQQIQQYQSIFKAVLQIKNSAWCLGETRKIIRSWYSKSASTSPSDLVSFRSLYSCLNEMEHWIRSIDSCLGNQVSGCGGNSWKKLLEVFEKEEQCNVDLLIQAHGKYLDEIVIRCLLGGDQTEVINITNKVKKVRIAIRKLIVEILAMVCEYYRIVSVNHWESCEAEAARQMSHNYIIINTVTNLHKRFRTFVDCLLEILKKTPQDSYLSYLLMSLDFNQFYYKPTLV